MTQKRPPPLVWGTPSTVCSALASLDKPCTVSVQKLYSQQATLTCLPSSDSNTRWTIFRLPVWNGPDLRTHAGICGTKQIGQTRVGLENQSENNRHWPLEWMYSTFSHDWWDYGNTGICHRVEQQWFFSSECDLIHVKIICRVCAKRKNRCLSAKCDNSCLGKYLARPSASAPKSKVGLVLWQAKVQFSLASSCVVTRMCQSRN